MKKISFLLIFLIGLAVNILAQQNNFRTFSINDGLSQSTIMAIKQDARGYLWVGTNGGGINRFDGTNFLTFNQKNGLTGNTVRCITEDSRGNLWIGTENGISLYDGYRFRSITNKNGLSGSAVLCIFESSTGTIWAGTNDGGLNKINITSKDSLISQAYTKKDGLVSNFIFDISEDQSGRLWLAMVGGVNVLSFQNETVQVKRLVKGVDIPGDVILSVEKDNAGDFWFGTQNNGVFKILHPSSDDSYVVKLIDLNTDTDKTIWDILSDNSGNIWLATNNSGVCKIEAEFIKWGNESAEIQYYNVGNGLPDNQILCLYEDVEENIWIGTNGSGLSQFLGESFAHYTTKEGLSHNQVFDIQQDSDGDYWLASAGGGLMQLSFSKNEPVIRQFDSGNGLPENTINSVVIDKNNDVWIGTASKGICKFDGKNFVNYTEKDGLCNNSINALFIDSQSNVWCGTSGGVSMFDGSRFISITEHDGLINNEVQTIIEDSDGKIWFGTFGGIAWTDKESMTDYDETDGLIEKRVRSLVEDELGNIWIGTFGGGLFRFDKESTDSIPIKLIADASIISSDNIYSLVFEDNNTLIVATDKGFDKLIFDSLQNIINVRSYNSSDGFIGIENNQNAILKDNVGNIWFGTVNGLTKYNVRRERIDLPPPKTHIVGLKLFFEEVDWSTKVDGLKPWFNLPLGLSLPYSSNHLTFTFNAISLKNPGKVRYSYMLEGLDENWSPVRKENEAQYPGLAPGKYTFKVKATNGIVWNSTPESFNFIIQPPIWKRWWFYAIIVSVLFVLIISYIQYRVRALEEKNKILEDKVAERTRELKMKNESILDSIKYAKRIQEAILPSQELISKIVPDFFILFKPRDIVSGDFYWTHQDDGLLIIAAADCTGHGVPGAFMSMLGITFMNEIVISNKIVKANEILNELREKVKTSLKQCGKENEATDGMDIAICVLDIKTKKIQFAGAYNPLFIFKNSDKEIDFIETKADRMPIGIHINDSQSFTNHSLDIDRGDTFYIFSDGFIDQFGGLDGKKFKSKQFKQTLIDIQDKPMKQQKEILESTLKEWQGNLEQVDDILVIGMKL